MRLRRRRVDYNLEEEEDIQHDGYYRGGMWADSDAEEEPLEISDDDGDEDPAPPLVPRAPVAPAPTPAGGDLEHPGDDEEEEDNQDDGPPAQREP